MNAHNHPLFRKEVLNQRPDRLHGDVSIALPISWQLIGGFLIVALSIALYFVATAHYSRSQTVTGAVVLDRGVAAILPSRPGVVVQLLVEEGQRITAGTPLIRIRAEEDLTGGRSASDEMMAALVEQDRRLARQASLLGEAAAAERERLGTQIGGAAQEIASLDKQIQSQRRLVAVAENEYVTARNVAQRGFISRRELDARQATLLGRRQELAQLEQMRSAKRAELAATQQSIAQSGASAEAQAASVQSSRAQLAQRLAEVEGTKGYTIIAPVDGTATAVTARVGQPATSGEPLMLLVPEGARTRAELYVPTQAAGFLAEGQDVRLAIDAFPYQRYGTVPGDIVEISSAAIPRPTSSGASVPVYLVAIELPRPWVRAFGRQEALLPGMTLSARIITERQTLVEWLFEPLYAVAQR